MIAMLSEYKLAAGNDAQDDLESFTSLITDGDDQEGFDAPKSYALWTQGERHKTGDGNDFWEGYSSLKWKVTRCTNRRYRKIRYDILNGNYSGPATVQTLKNGDGGEDGDTYAIYNAILDLEELPNLNNPPGTTMFVDFEMTFTRLEWLEDVT